MQLKTKNIYWSHGEDFYACNCGKKFYGPADRRKEFMNKPCFNCGDRGDNRTWWSKIIDKLTDGDSISRRDY